MLVSHLIFALKTANNRLDPIEQTHGIALGDFAAAFVAQSHEVLERELADKPIILKLLEKDIEHCRVSNTQLPGLLRTLYTLAAAVDSPQAWQWLESKRKAPSLTEIASWTLDANPLSEAAGQNSMKVLGMLYQRHGKALFKTRLYSDRCLFGYAIGQNAKKAALWMVEKDPILLKEAICLSSRQEKNRRYMDVLDYARSSCPSNSTLPDALRSLSLSLKAREALVEINDMSEMAEKMKKGKAGKPRARAKGQTGRQAASTLHASSHPGH